MSHHLTKDGKIKSDEFPDLPEGYVAIDVSAPEARIGLFRIAEGYAAKDPKFAEDLQRAVMLANLQTHWKYPS